MNSHPETDASHNNFSGVQPSSSSEQSSQLNKKQKNEESFLSMLLKFGIIAVVIVLPIRLYIAQPFIVSGSSMQPTFESGEYLIVDQLSYRFADPERGDVIIFRFPLDTSKFFIKRVIALPSETVSMIDGVVTVTNDEYPDGKEVYEPYLNNLSSDSFNFTLGDNEYFVLGDNRNASSDSRMWGPVDEQLIIGRALLRLLPVGHASILPGTQEKIDGVI